MEPLLEAPKAVVTAATVALVLFVPKVGLVALLVGLRHPELRADTIEKAFNRVKEFISNVQESTAQPVEVTVSESEGGS